MSDGDDVPYGYRIEPAAGDFAVRAAEILADLPEWFGRPEARAGYAAATGRLPTFVALSESGTVAGFVTVERHTSVAAELHVIAVVRTHHRRGCGRQLVAHVEQISRATGVHWLTVKTIAASHPDPHYAATRRFYAQLGFEPLEVFPRLWDEAMPCLQLVKAVG